MKKIGILANVRDFIDKKNRNKALNRVFENIALAEEMELQESKKINNNVIRNDENELQEVSLDDKNVISIDELFEMNWISEIQNRGFMTPNKEYIGGDYLPMEIVSLEPEKYVINECLDACKVLWGKNIYTYSTSDYNDNYSSITILVDNLSIENMDIITNYINSGVDNYGVKIIRRGNCLDFKIDAIGEYARIALLNIAGMFTIQDVPEKIAYIAVDNVEKDYAWYLENLKPGYVVDGDSNRIYINQFHYYKHMRYVDASRVYNEEFSLKKTV